MVDYTDFKDYPSEREANENKHKGPKTVKAAMKELSEGTGTSYWWGEQDDVVDSLGNRMVAQGKAIRQSAQMRLETYIAYTRMYEGANVDNLDIPNAYLLDTRTRFFSNASLTFNVVAACIDTIAAKVSKNRPVPTFLTSGSSWKLQRKARGLNQWVRGFFNEIEIYKHAKAAFIDAEVTGNGYLHMYEDADCRLAVERVKPDEILVDNADGVYSRPRQMFRRKLIQKEVVLAAFPDKREEIINSQPTEVNTTRSVNLNSHTDLIEVWEAWHLPSSPDAGDGRHVIAMDSGTVLCDEPWCIDQFPFIMLRAKERTIGFYGRGTADALTGIQVEINRVVNTIKEQLRRKQKNTIFVERGAKINANHIDNSMNNIVEYTGTRPSMDNSNVVSAEDYNWLETMYRKAFQEVGVSELSAISKKPAGLDAGVALREYSDIESERFALKHQAWDNVFVDAAALAIDLITKQFGWEGYEIKLTNGRNSVSVDWKDVCLDPDSYTMEIFPSSSLPQTPAARKQETMELYSDGFIDQTTARKLLNFPDVQEELNLANAAIDDVDWTISQILDSKKPILHPPEPYQNIQLLAQRAQANYLICRQYEDMDAARMEMLRSLMNQCSEILAQAAAAAQAAQPQPGQPQ